MKYIIVGTSHAAYEVIQTLLKTLTLRFRCLKVLMNHHSYPVVFKAI